MLKKVFKNFMLFFSVLTAFVLVYQIWFGSYFFTDGYDYFMSGVKTRVVNPIIRLFTKQKSTDFSQNLKILLKPEQIVLHHSGERRVFQSGSDDFDELSNLAREIISEILLGQQPIKTKETVDMDTYLSVLKGKSLYVDYGKSCDFRLLSFGLCGQEKNQLTNDISVANGYIISLHDGILNDISLYIMDHKSGNIYRYVVERDKNKLDSRLKEYIKVPIQGNMPSYSFELNFHKAQEETVSKVLFDPTVLIGLTSPSVPQVEAVFTQELEQMLQEGPTDEILEVFSINNRSMWKYTDLNNARVFVENNATLTLYPNGFLEYQTIQGGRGLDIAASADRTNYDIYAATANAVDFVTALCRQLPAEIFSHLNINTALVNETANQGSYKIAFDYVIDGNPIRYKSQNGYAPAIEIEIKDGYLIAYRQLIRVYNKTEETCQLSPLLKAADHLVDLLYDGENPLHINKASICYAETDEGVLAPKWQVLVNNAEHVIE